MEVIRNSGPPFLCIECGKESSSHKLRRAHERNVHGLPPYITRTVSKNFGGRPKGSKNKNPYPRTDAVLHRFVTGGKLLATMDVARKKGMTRPEETKQKMRDKWTNERREKQSERAILFRENNGKRKNCKTGHFCPKNKQKYAGDNKNIVYRSSWELLFMQRLDESDSILAWASEEIKIPYLNPIDNVWHHYYPDFVIKQRNKNGTVENVIVEVKPIHEVLRPIKKPRQKAETWNRAAKKWIINQAKWRAAVAFCEKHGSRFMVATKENGYDRFRLLSESEIIWNGK